MNQTVPFFEAIMSTSHHFVFQLRCTMVKPWRTSSSAACCSAALPMSVVDTVGPAVAAERIVKFGKNRLHLLADVPETRLHDTIYDNFLEEHAVRPHPDFGAFATAQLYVGHQFFFGFTVGRQA